MENEEKADLKMASEKKERKMRMRLNATNGLKKWNGAGWIGVKTCQDFETVITDIQAAIMTVSHNCDSESM